MTIALKAFPMTQKGMFAITYNDGVYIRQINSLLRIPVISVMRSMTAP
jgi:hypothetical protein